MNKKYVLTVEDRMRIAEMVCHEGIDYRTTLSAIRKRLEMIADFVATEPCVEEPRKP